MKYKLWSVLEEWGDCYCEVTLAGREQIDLVWVQSRGIDSGERIVGIEVKTPAEFERSTRELTSQVEKYRERTVEDVNEASYVSGDAVSRAEDVYLFDEVWVVAVGGQDRWTVPWREGTPEDGWLNYNRATGRLQYEIDAVADRETIQIAYPERVREAQLAAALWRRYWSAQTLVAAESWISELGNRSVREGRVKYRTGKGQGGKRKDADLSVAKRRDVQPVTTDSTIRGLEIKASFNARVKEQLRKQLPVYRDSKMYSNVYLVVPEDVSGDAHEFLESEFERVGLLAVSVESDFDVSQRRRADEIELQKVPVRSCPGGGDGFVL